MTQTTIPPQETIVPKEQDKVTGAACATLLAAGIGCLTMGIMTTLAAASVPIANSLKWVGPVGPLSGKTTIAVLVWLVSWLILHFLWRKREVNFT